MTRPTVTGIDLNRLQTYFPTFPGSVESDGGGSMLFNSHAFILGFLPIALFGTVVLNRLPSRLPCLIWLVICSFGFYGWWDLRMLPLFVGSVLANYAISHQIRRRTPLGKKIWLGLGLALNLSAIGYYKYAGFIVASINETFASGWPVPHILLPVGISFYTFQQIAYLIDTYRGDPDCHDLTEYSLFVAFFPQLIAGPIVHHREMLPQLAERRLRFTASNMAVGLTIFAIGLFKKQVIADSVAPFANDMFAAAANGQQLTILEAWLGVLSYTFQIYFDFSGYSDMAIGLGRLFDVKLPINFDSPYRATNIIDFWRRWHITLSRFLRDYIYFPLGGGRCHPLRRHFNLFLTMLLGGLWHGAGWTFVIWGGLHGVFLIVNHSWRSWLNATPDRDDAIETWQTWLSRALTLVVVMVAWVFFRSVSLLQAWTVLVAMAGSTEIGFARQLLGMQTGPASVAIPANLSGVGPAIGWSVILLAIVWLMPNTQQLLGRVRPALNYRFRPTGADWRALLINRLQWRPAFMPAIWYAVVAAVAFCSLTRTSEFIYFNF